MADEDHPSEASAERYIIGQLKHVSTAARKQKKAEQKAKDKAIREAMAALEPPKPESDSDDLYPPGYSGANIVTFKRRDQPMETLETESFKRARLERLGQKLADKTKPMNRSEKKALKAEQKKSGSIHFIDSEEDDVQVPESEEDSLLPLLSERERYMYLEDKKIQAFKDARLREIDEEIEREREEVELAARKKRATVDEEVRKLRERSRREAKELERVNRYENNRARMGRAKSDDEVQEVEKPDASVLSQAERRRLAKLEVRHRERLEEEHGDDASSFSEDEA